MKKNVRTAIAAILTGTAILMAGCQSGKPSAEPSKDMGSTDGSTYKVGIIQLIDNGAFADMREGFIQELNEKGYGEDKVTINYKNAQGDATNLNSICQEMADSKVDLIAAIATPAAQAIVNMETDIPVIFISVSNPVGAGIITDMEKPDKNATGTSNAIPVNEIFDLAEKLTPGCKTFGFLYNTGEVNSVTTVENSKKYLTSIGLSYEEAVVTNSSEVQQAAQSLIGKVDAIFVPNDSVIQSAMPLVSEVARNAKIPVYASSATTVNSGAFATIAISDKEIGKLSADMAIKYFEGTPISEIPAIVVPASSTVINQDAADALGITFDDGVKASAIFVHDAK